MRASFVSVLRPVTSASIARRLGSGSVVPEGVTITYRVKRAKPKTGFAAGSKFRHPDYPFKAA